MDLQSLNTKYEYLHPKQRLEKLFEDFDQEKILVTTSLGSTSVILLHLLSEIKPGHPVYFIDTSYHFKETQEYKEHTRFDLLRIHRPLVLYLFDEPGGPFYGACHKLRKERYIKSEVCKVIYRLYIFPVDVHHVGYGLERVERDPYGKDDLHGVWVELQSQLIEELLGRFDKDR